MRFTTISLLGVLAGAVVFFLTMLLATAAGKDRAPGSHLYLRAWHHAYAGYLLWGLALLYVGPVRVVVQGIALMLVWDDAVQHAVQFASGNVGWRSPLHRVYARAWQKWRWVRDWTAWLDARFGTTRR